VGNNFPKKHEVLEHVLTHHGDGTKNHQCDDCGKCFLTIMKLKLHKTTIHGAKTLKCNQCNKMFGYKKVLTEHIDNVHGIKDCRCLQCNKFFTEKGLVHHEKIVHNRTLNCSVCDKAFGKKIRLGTSHQNGSRRKKL